MLPLYGKTVTEWSVGEHGAFVKKCGTQFPESRQGAVLSRGRGRRHMSAGSQVAVSVLRERASGLIPR